MRQILQHIESHGTVYQAFNKCRHPTKLGISAIQTIDDMMQKDDETTAKELVVTLRVNGISLSTTTAQNGQHLLGWTRHETMFLQSVNMCTKLCQKTVMGSSIPWEVLCHMDK